MPGGCCIHGALDEKGDEPSTENQLLGEWESFEDEGPQKVIYLHFHVEQLMAVKIEEQSFKACFDMFVRWIRDPEDPNFEPLIRFPTSTDAEENEYGRLILNPMELPSGKVIIGYSQTISGTFQTVQNLTHFPFDCQPLTVCCLLGLDKGTKQQLSEDAGYTLMHAPDRANTMMSQIDAELDFRPPRYSLSETNSLESDERIPMYSLVIACERNYRYYLYNVYFVMALIKFMCVGVVFVEPWQINDRLMIPLTLLLVLVAFKFSINERLPCVPYLTALDLYGIFSFSTIFAVFLAVCVLYWVEIWGHCDADDMSGFIYGCQFPDSGLKSSVWLGVAQLTNFFAGHIGFLLHFRYIRNFEKKKVGSFGIIDQTLLKKLNALGIFYGSDGTTKQLKEVKALINEARHKSHIEVATQKKRISLAPPTPPVEKRTLGALSPVADGVVNAVKSGSHSLSTLKNLSPRGMASDLTLEEKPDPNPRSAHKIGVAPTNPSDVTHWTLRSLFSP